MLFNLVGELPAASALRVKLRVVSAKEAVAWSHPQKLTASHQWDEDDFDLAVRYLRAFLQQLRQSQEPPASPWKKNAHCAGSLMITISDRSSCWL
jgi:hypothetical protein